MQIRLKKVIPLMAFAGLLSYPLVACGPENPFWPGARLKVMSVVTTSNTNGVAGIEQDIAANSNSPTNQAVIYRYFEPTVLVQNEAFAPTANFTKMGVTISLDDGTTLPLKEYPLRVRINEREAAPTLDGNNSVRLLSIRLPFLSVDTDLRSVVFPGNNAPRVNNGTADIALSATDDNGHNHTLNFTVPLEFKTNAFVGDRVPPVVPSPSPSPSPSATPAP